MDQIQLLVLAGLGGAFIGLCIGVLAGKRTSNEHKRSQQLEQDLTDSKLELDNYKHEVEQHFSETADAFQTLNDSYATLHHKLAAGAQALCSEMPVGPLLAEPGKSSAISPSITAADTATEINEMQNELPLEPPRDYAPKKDPKETGMLNEDFGIKKDPVSANDAA